MLARKSRLLITLIDVNMKKQRVLINANTIIKTSRVISNIVIIMGVKNLILDMLRWFGHVTAPREIREEREGT